jgi:hypothetical protein
MSQLSDERIQEVVRHSPKAKARPVVCPDPIREQGLV